MYLALNEVDSTKYPLPKGLIVGMNLTLQGLRNAGFPAGTYTGNRLVNADHTDANVWDDDCNVGWHWDGAKVVRSLPLVNSDIVLRDIGIVQNIFWTAEDGEFQELLVRAKVDTTVDSGHSWFDDMLHSKVKPLGREVTMKLAAEKASANPNPANYADALRTFKTEAVTPGLIGFWDDALRGTWRPLRGGTVVWEYDPATGGTKAGTNRNVSYPAGLTVATWNFYKAIEDL